MEKNTDLVESWNIKNCLFGQANSLKPKHIQFFNHRKLRKKWKILIQEA